MHRENEKNGDLNNSRNTKAREQDMRLGGLEISTLPPACPKGIPAIGGPMTGRLMGVGAPSVARRCAASKRSASDP
jgi:hypothetical protein